MSEEALFDDVEQENGGDKLELLAGLCKEYRSLEEEIQRIEDLLKERKKALETVSREKIPAVLNSTGLSEIRLSTGEKLKVEDQVQASIADKNYTLAYRNMINSEGGDDHATQIIDALFKSSLVIEGVSDEVLDVLLENEIPYDTKRTIHHATLKKYCGGLLENGRPIPEGISVFQYQETKITN